MTGGDSTRLIILFLAGLASVLWGNLNRNVEPRAAEELEVVPPTMMQLAVAGGDRFLAANLNAWRATVVSTVRLAPAAFDGLATLQEDASWFNPAHEDNYYIATAVLPWEGRVEQTQTILQRAIEGRPDDLWPAFYWGFNQVHFLGDGPGGAKGALIAAERAGDEASQSALRTIATQWSEKGEDADLSIRLLRQMTASTRDKNLRAQLEKRLQRMEGLQTLRAASDLFQRQHGSAAQSLEQLVSAGVLQAIPVDPLGKGYRMEAGKPVLVQ